MEEVMEGVVVGEVTEGVVRGIMASVFSHRSAMMAWSVLL